MNIKQQLRMRLTEHRLIALVASLVIHVAMAASYSERDLDLIPHFTFSFAENYIKSRKKSSGQKVFNKGFKYFSESYYMDLKGKIILISYLCMQFQVLSRDVMNFSTFFISLL